MRLAWLHGFGGGLSFFCNTSYAHIKFGVKITRSQVEAIAFVDSVSLSITCFWQFRVEENSQKKRKKRNKMVFINMKLLYNNDTRATQLHCFFFTNRIKSTSMSTDFFL